VLSGREDVEGMSDGSALERLRGKEGRYVWKDC